MSSIDKDMQDIAGGYDRRVRVRNSSITKGAGGCNGYIRFYINGDCILTLKDRYGYIHDDEREQIRRAILDYQSRERDAERQRAIDAERRRREDEERRRREEEERRRRLEAERIAAYNKLKASAISAKNSVEAAYASVKKVESELKQRTDEITASLSAAKFETDGVRTRISQMEKKRQSAMTALTEEYGRKKERISHFQTIQNNLSTDDYKRMQRELDAVGLRLTAASFDREEVERIKTYVKELIAAQQKLFARREQFLKDVEKGGAAAEIAKLAVQQIDGIDKSSTEQIEAIFNRLDEARERIAKCNDETEVFRIAEELRNAPKISHVESQFIPRQSSYQHVDYKSQCQEAAEELQRYYDALKGKEYTTATRGELEFIERALQEFSCGMAGKNLLDSIRSMTDLVRIIRTDDGLCEEIFKDYDKLKKELEEVGVTCEPLDAFNYLEQRERMLEELCRRKTQMDIERGKEEAEDKRSVLSFGVRSAFAEQGLYFVSGRVSDGELCEELVFALPGVDDAVIKAEVTEDSLHWYVCGTVKEDGTAVSAERVLEIMREFDRSGKPQQIINSLSQTLKIQSGEISSAVDSVSENALQQIVANGTFALSQQLTSGDGKTVTAGEVMREISQTFSQEAERNRSQYAAGAATGSTQISAEIDRFSGLDGRVFDRKLNKRRTRELERPKPKKQNANAMRVKYMH